MYQGQGNGGGVISKAPPQILGSIPRALSMLNDSHNEVSKALHYLQERLEPVLTPSQPTSEVPGAAVDHEAHILNASQHGAQVYQAITTTNQHIAILRQLVERLAL